MKLKGSKTETHLKEAFAGESQANRRYLYFAQKGNHSAQKTLDTFFASFLKIPSAHGDVHFCRA